MRLVDLLNLFQPLSVTEVALIESAFEQRSVKEDEILFRAGGICRTLYFIVSGVLRIVNANEKGVMTTHHFLKDGQFCTILYSFRNQTQSLEGIEAACDCELIQISRDRLHALYKDLPWLSDIIDQIIEQTLLDKIAMQNAYHGQDAATRYRLFLTRQPELALRVTQQDIASYLGITPQSLSRIRRQQR
jgi:CRP-like cAMP-binding protein